MRIDRRTTVFFDASCLIAAAGSPAGGSGFLLSVCDRGFLRGAVSPPVLAEAERNVLAKLDAEAQEAYRRLVQTSLTVISPPSEEWRLYEPIVGEKDGHVVAAAIAAHAPFLLTLDKSLANRVNDAKLAVRALAPGDFITTVLPDHLDYASIR